MDKIKNPHKWDPKFVSSECCSHIILKFIFGMIYFMAASQNLPGGTDTKKIRISSSLAKIKTGHLLIKAKSITAAPTSSVRPIETAICVANY